MCTAVICSNFFQFYKINGNGQIKNSIYIDETQQYHNEQNKLHIIYQHFAQTLTEHQLKHIYKFQEDIKYNEHNNIATQTRALTDTEIQRITELRHQYIQNDLRPQNELATEPVSQQFYIDFNNRIFHYPERELTDEEILQLVEWDLAIEYANSLQYENQYFSETDSITEQQVIQTAKQYIEKLFDADTENLKISANYYHNSDIQPDGWFIRLYPEGDMPYALNWNYAVWIVEEQQKQMITVARSSQNYEYEMIDKNDMDLIINDKNWLIEARAIIVQKTGRTDIQHVSIMNMENNDTKQNTVDIKVTMNDGCDYIVSLYYPYKALKAMTMPIVVE